MFLRILAREKKQLSWPEAIRRCTLLPAETMGLKNKGRLRAGMDADLVVFDPQTISERARFIDQPDAPPLGIHRVMVGGRTAVVNNEIVNETLGRIIRHT